MNLVWAYARSETWLKAAFAQSERESFLNLRETGPDPLAGPFSGSTASSLGPDCGLNRIRLSTMAYIKPCEWKGLKWICREGDSEPIQIEVGHCV
jgi:hypothetical protein